MTSPGEGGRQLQTKFWIEIYVLWTAQFTEMMLRYRLQLSSLTKHRLIYIQGSSPAVDYVESRLAELAHKSINDPDLRALLSGGAESNVDVVLYLLPHLGMFLLLLVEYSLLS